MYDRQRSIQEARAVDLSSTDFELTRPTRAVYIGGSGNLTVELSGAAAGVTVTYAVLAGQRHPLQVRKIVRATTTATLLIAEF